jgi:predicted TIM-barrel fold metal-dependent hydrolase
MNWTRRQALLTLPALASTRLRGAEPTFECIDTHTHMHRSAPEMVAALERANWRCLSICDSREIDDQPSILDDMIRGTKILHSESNGRIAWATTFDPRPFDAPDFAPRVIANLQRDFKDEALAVKLWKNVGMAAHSKSGQYLMPDSKVLTPILEEIEKRGKTLITHLAEPDPAWLPLGTQDSSYYRQHPEWHIYGKPQIPSKDAILQARDRMIARHPRLRVIGCHLGSNEEHLDQLAKRFDELPNFAVDVASRVRYLTRVDREMVRQFVAKYQDRIIYGTDFTLGQGDVAHGAASLLSTHEREWNYFSGTGESSLGLSESILKKIFHDNAGRWIPGIIG